MVETVGICQVMWFVMLASANDRVIGVDTPGQQVLLSVRYGTTCLLIRDAVGSVVIYLSYGTATILAKPGIRPIVNLCNDI
jgi:hypothetical protein